MEKKVGLQSFESWYQVLRTSTAKSTQICRSFSACFHRWRSAASETLECAQHRFLFDDVLQWHKLNLFQV